MYLYSFNQYLCDYFVPVTVPGAKGKVTNKVDKNLCFNILVGGRDGTANMQTKNMSSVSI